MRFLIFCSSLLCLATIVQSQSVTTCQSRNSTGRSYKDVLLTNVLAVTTQYFSENSVGDDGISRIDASLVYNLPDLFELRYGKGASTAPFLAGFLDILNSKPTSLIPGGIDYLSNIIGLVQLGEFDAARAATSLLIFSALPDDFPLEDNELSPMQVNLLSNAVRSSLNSLRQALSTTNFEVYLNLKVGSALSFALDTTGSMAGEIAAAQERIRSIIQSTRNTIDQPLLYVLSPFNDPETGPLTRTSDPNVIISDLNDLVANGGGDTPELALKGIESAILASTRRSVVFMITDAPAKDFSLTSRVIALAIIRKVRIISLLTNNIVGSAGFTLYDKISSASGGLVTVTDKASIGSITELFTILTAQGQIKLDVTPISHSDVIVFTVDSTVTNVNIVLSGDVTFDDVIDSDGVPVPADATTTSGLITVRLLDTIAGEYRIFVRRELNYSSEISGQSTFGAIPSIFEKVDGEYIHRAQPVAGSDAHVAVTLFGNAPSNDDRIEGNIGSNAVLEEVLLVGQDGSILIREKVDNCSGVDEYRTMNGFTIPSVRFFVKMIGRDRQGLPFVRVDPCAITPLVAKIDLTPIDDVAIYAGQSLIVSTVLTNREEIGDIFTFDVSDPRGYAVGSITSAFLGSGSNQILQIQLEIPSDAVEGSLSVVTVTATPIGKDEFVFTTFSVAARNNDTIKCPALRSPAGSIITCSDFNKVGSVCELSCEPGYALMKMVNSTCQSNETWTTDNLSCTFVGTKQCSISGDPHYVTFDGQLYDFQGTCMYSTVKTTFNETMGNLEPFSIMVENEHLGSVTTVSWFRRAYITVYDTTFVFSKGRTVTVNDLTTTLPFSMADRGLRVSLSGVNVVMTTRFGLQIVYNGKFNILIQLSASYAGLVEGLCGNLNGDPNDDLTLPTNTSVIVSPNDFGNNFKVGGENEGCQDGDDADGIGDCLDVEDYASLCSIVNQTCFEECRKEIPITDVSKNCVFDLCVTIGDKQVLEQALSKYADSCQASGITVCDWRKETDTEIACPSSSHYEHEGSSCPNTCQAPTQASRCATPPVAGCVCNDGYVLSGRDCVPLSNCGCTSAGKYYKAGEQFYDLGCTSFCSCKNGFLNCSSTNCDMGETCRISKQTGKLGCEPLSFATCKASGDPHYVAFNGKLFDFQGRCTYLLARFGGISISAENENRDGNTKVSYIKAVRINFNYAQTTNVTITLGDFFDSNQPAAKIEGLFTNGEQILDTFEGQGFQIFKRGNQIVADIGRIEIAFTHGSVRIVVPENMAAEAVGLCETRNDNVTGNFTMMNGNITKDVNEFADSYRIGYCNDTGIPDSFVCSSEQEELYASNEYCGKIYSEIFANISAEIDLVPYFNDCVFDLCATNGSLSSFEDVLVNLVYDIERVLDLSFGPCNWREIIGIPPLICPENSHYEGCTSACPNTCLNQFAQDSCGIPKSEGCECNFGYVWSQGECVRPQNCGCYNQMLGYLPQGYSETDSNCTTRCGCFGPNKYECRDARCDDGNKCTAVGDTFECRPTETNCVLWGATYISTFDGKQFNFNGGCSYILTRAFADDDIPSFSVEIDKHESPESCVEDPGFTLTIRIGSHMKMVVSDGGRSLHVNGHRVRPGTKTQMYEISAQPTFTTIRFVFGLTVRTSAQGSRVLLTATQNLQEKLMGLCGFSDGNPENDFAIGTTDDVTDDATEFGNYWRIEEENSDDEDKKCAEGTRMDDVEMIRSACKNRKYFNLFTSVLSCGAIADPESVHAACHEAVPPQAVVKACIAALCQKKSYLDILENTIVSYNLICRIRNSPYDLDEVDFESNLVCPPNSTYSKKAPACVKTCDDPEGAMCSSDEFSRSLPLGEGCVCKDGLLWNNGSCVEDKYCGCKDPETGYYVESGTCGWNQNCSKHCSCNEGIWECDEGGCHDDQYCGMRQGRHGCYYKDECKYDNGGCSHMCESSNSSVTCNCPVGMFLVDDKNCKMLDRRACLSDETIYTAAVKEWKNSYQDWRDHYYNKYKQIFEASEIGELTCFEKDATQKCSIEWTRWYNTDSPSNCGDDETLGRIQQIFPDEVCENPLAIDVRVKGQQTSERTMSDWVMRLKSGQAGLLCHNSDQEEGKVCPDFEVRFLCEAEE